MRRDLDDELLDLFEESGRNVLRTAEVLHDLVRDHPDASHLAGELVHSEHEGDRITHDIMQRLSVADGLKPIMTLADGHALATALDDIVDFSEQTGDWLGLYGIEATMDQAVTLAGVLVDAAGHVSHAVAQLRHGSELGPALQEINRLENEADRLYREAVASLFANGIDPMVVIRWKDVFESLESAVDACEKVAHVLEGIELKRGR